MVYPQGATSVDDFFARARASAFFFRGRECARTLLERKIKNVRAQLGTQTIFVRSRGANVLDTGLAFRQNGEILFCLFEKGK